MRAIDDEASLVIADGAIGTRLVSLIHWIIGFYHPANLLCVFIMLGSLGLFYLYPLRRALPYL